VNTPASPRAQLPTEQENPASKDLDRLSVADAFDVMNREDVGLAAAVARAKPEIVRAIEIVSDRLAAGGRLFHVGAGTSGRLGVLDAAECPPTFGTEPWQVQAVIAGGAPALVGAVEGAEDDRSGGGRELGERGVGKKDVVFGIAAGGTTPYVHGAIAHARHVGAATIFLACVPRDLVPDEADVSIRVLTGPEVIAGSTRLKAGTATKMVLNLVSTLAMVRLGKVYGNLMVDVDASGNSKLRDRGIGLVSKLVPCDPGLAERLLDLANGQVKVAILMGCLSIDATAARARLAAAGGFLRRARAKDSMGLHDGGAHGAAV
jgi:N-acetylmuramic acid 6-phosphate etherase